MEMSGERQIAASRAEVWAARNDPEVLKACIPGCQEMEKSGDNGFTAKVVQKVGPVKATFTGEVELSDIVEGESYTISGKGKGGAAGGASGGAQVSLADSEGGTLLTYTAEAKVTGKIATDGTLHYAGDPRLTLSFAGDPTGCTRNTNVLITQPTSRNERLCLTEITDMQAMISVGGRYLSNAAPEPDAFLVDDDFGCEG